MTAVDGLVGQLGAVEPLATSVGVLVIAAVVAAILTALALRLRRQRESRVVDVLFATALGFLALAVGGLLVALWDATGLVSDVLAFFGNPVQTATDAIATFTILAVIYVGSGILHRAVGQFVEGRNQISQHQAEVTFRVVQVTVYTVALIAVLGVWDVDLSGLLVGAGFLGIVLGMAARQTIGAMIAGFVLMFSRPFEIGDWVEIGDKEGVVTDITIVNTRIQSFSGEYVMLPNDVVSSTDIVNRTRKGRLRIEVDIGVDYDTDLEAASDVARTALRDVDEILTVPQPQVVIKEFGNSSIVLGLRFWIDKPTSRKRWRARTAAIRTVKAAYDEQGISIPFPQRVLSERADAGDGGFAIGEEPAEVEPTPDGGDE